MKLQFVSIIVLTFPIIGASVFSCTNGKKIKPEMNNDKPVTGSKDTLTYHYQDASVPPQYHRSYSIRVIPGQVLLSVDSYGEILLEDSIPLENADYDSFLTAITALQIRNRNEVRGEGCTGGHSESLDFYPGTGKELKGNIYYCGGQQYGNLEGDVLAAANLFKALIPDLSKKIDATMKNN